MFLKKFDFLSPNITLYYYNQKRHSSFIGGILTLIMSIITIYIIIHYSLIKAYPNSASLSIFRNYDKKVNMFFDKSNMFHYLWIYNEKNILKNNIDQNLFQLNNLKKGIIRIYMTYSYEKYDYNASNLKDNDHWVYDTCPNYYYKDDYIYDLSFSSCIKYYYNNNEKKYYSINDNSNFKWPYIKQNISNNENIYLGIFVEKCSNDSILNEILGECYPEEKINEYLYYFNKIFFSFINNKIQINHDNKPIKQYSHKIYDNLNNNKINFYIHDLTFLPINYKHSTGLFSTKINYDFFKLDEDKATKLYKTNNILLIAYIFHFKEYINEVRQKNNNALEALNCIGGLLFLIYTLFYGFNYILNERIIIRNFHMFLNDKDNSLIQRHINYERNKLYSFKSNIYGNFSNDLFYKNDGYNSLKSTYFGNFMRSDMTHLTHINNLTEGNQNINSNKYTIKINRIDSEEKERPKKTDNIIVINNNSFMNDNSKNKYISNSSLEKYNSLKLIDKYDKIENLKGLHKVFTYNRSPNESKSQTQSISKIKSIIKDNNLSFIKVNKNTKNNKHLETINSKRNESSEHNSKQKIIDTSSISLLNGTNQNKIPNFFIANSYNDYEIKTHQSNAEQKLSLNPFSKLDTKVLDISNKIVPTPKNSFNQLDNNINSIGDISPCKKIKKSIKFTDTTLENHERRKSHQTRNNIKSEKDLDDRYNNHKLKSKKTGNFLKLPVFKRERHLSLFSRNSFIPSERTNEISSPKARKSSNEQYQKFTNVMGKKMQRQNSEIDAKTIKKNRKSSFKHLNYQENNEFIKMIHNSQLSIKNILNYIFLCKARGNSIYILKDFRQKLLSEEYLFILHINMFIFKQKYGCKSHLDQLYLLDDLYNDY